MSGVTCYLQNFVPFGFFSHKSSVSSGQLRQYRNWLRPGRSEDRIPVGARFSAPVQIDPGAPQPPVQWIPGLSQGKERPGRETDLNEPWP
jgi:hypothetical protein